MVLKAMKFTPEVMLSAPRRQPGIPSPDGLHVLSTTSSYNFSAHESTTEIRVYNQEGESLLVERDKKSSDPVWLDGDEMALLRGMEGSTTHLVVGNARDFAQTLVHAFLPKD